MATNKIQWYKMEGKIGFQIVFNCGKRTRILYAKQEAQACVISHYTDCIITQVEAVELLNLIEDTREIPGVGYSCYGMTYFFAASEGRIGLKSFGSYTVH